MLSSSVEQAPHNKGKRILTRKYASIWKLIPINPIIYHDCILCSKSYYTVEKLRNHYKVRHKYYFGDAPLPKSKLELINHRVREVKNFDVCYICLKKFPDIMEHRVQNHINPKFLRYSCNFCQTKFLTLYSKKSHEKKCSF